MLGSSPSSTFAPFDEIVEEVEPEVNSVKRKFNIPHILKVTDYTTQTYDEAFFPSFTTKTPPPECHPDG